MRDAKAIPATGEGGSWARMLRAVPVRNRAARVREHGEGLRITVQRRPPRWLVPPIRWVIRLRPEHTTELDGLGRRLWEDCDGQRSMEDLVEAFAARERLTFHEARVALTAQLRSLVERGAMALVYPEDEAATEHR